MKIGITGATGFIGSRIVEIAGERGHSVVGFTRNPACPVPGCAETRAFSTREKVNVDGCDAIIHLAGEPVAGLWTKKKRRSILESRTAGTRRIVQAIGASAAPPQILVSGSAVGYYGDTADTETDENSPPGQGFLAEVTQAWEREALSLAPNALRVVLLRTSIVLGKNGGVLPAMASVFRAGLGGPLGPGSQWVSWIHIDDEVALTLFVLENSNISGPVNACAPQPCRNAGFTSALASAVHRPAFFRVPAFVMKGLLGDFSNELLDSKRILPRRATAAGFTYRFPTLESALADIFPSAAARK